MSASTKGNQLYLENLSRRFMEEILTLSSNSDSYKVGRLLRDLVTCFDQEIQKEIDDEIQARRRFDEVYKTLKNFAELVVRNETSLGVVDRKLTILMGQEERNFKQNLKKQKYSDVCHSSRLLFFYSIPSLRFRRKGDVIRIADLFLSLEDMNVPKEAEGFVKNVVERGNDLNFALEAYERSIDNMSRGRIQ